VRSTDGFRARGLHVGGSGLRAATAGNWQRCVMKTLDRIRVAILLGATQACVRAASQPPRAEPIPDALRVSYRQLSEPSTSRPMTESQGSVQELVPPTMSAGNAAPPYPTGSVPAECGDALVAVRLMIDATGGVAQLFQSPLVASSGPPCDEPFQQITYETVRSWKFAPAFRQVLIQGASDGPFGQPKWETEAISWLADFAFRFQRIGGRGVVAVPRAKP